MPVRRAEESPRYLYDGIRSVRDLAVDRSHRWYVAHTRSQMERAFAEDLQARCVPYFLPMESVCVRSGGQTFGGLRPLFPSYVFFWGDNTYRYLALSTKKIATVLDEPNQMRLVKELTSLELCVKASIESGASINQWGRVVTGREYVVRGGMFEGMVCRAGPLLPAGRVAVVMTTLGRSVDVEIDENLLEPLQEL